MGRGTLIARVVVGLLAVPGVRRRLLLLVATAALIGPSQGAAPAEAPGEPVTIPGTLVPGCCLVTEVPARFGRPASARDKMAAVLILHGSGGVDGRGAFYAKTLQEAGITTLEITMFQAGRRPQRLMESMPYAAAALKWLAGQPNIDSRRLGVMGFSWGGAMSMLMSSELLQERMGKDVPKPAAFASFYPLCSYWAVDLVNPAHDFYNAHTRMSAAPMLIYVGTRDDYEEGERPCDALIAMWPAAAREHTTVRYVEGATHAFDSQRPIVSVYDQHVHAGRGGTASMIPSPKDAADARDAVVRFFVENLKRE